MEKLTGSKRSNWVYRVKENSDELKKEKVYHTTTNGILAFGVYRGDSFEIIEDSQVDMSRKTNLEKYNLLREKLIDSGKIVLENNKYILKMNLKFDSPSGASEFVLGGSRNGWTEWKDEENKTLDEIVRK